MNQYVLQHILVPLLREPQAGQQFRVINDALFGV